MKPVLLGSYFEKDDVVDEFHRLIYEGAKDNGTWAATHYFGYTTWKIPQDMWLMQEIMFEVRPRLLIETGTAFGGSALYFAHVFDQLSEGKVLSVEIDRSRKDLPRHPRIDYLSGHSSVDETVLGRVHDWAEHVGGPVMVVLDSDHSQKHVELELDAYCDLVTPGSYLVLEDTNINGHPVFPEHGPGPHEALEAWLPKHPDFKVDERKAKKYLFSFHSWLRRMRV